MMVEQTVSSRRQEKHLLFNLYKSSRHQEKHLLFYLYKSSRHYRNIYTFLL